MYENINFSSFKESIILQEYYFILIYSFIVTIISIVIILLSYLFSLQNPETEKLSPYECGFEPYEDARNKYDIKFYLIAILFVIFDLETVFLLPWVVSLSKLNLLGFWSMLDFMIELFVGFFYIWYAGALDWDWCIQNASIPI